MSTSSKIAVGHWRPAITAAATEIATYALSWPGAVVRDPVGLEATTSMIGAHIPLVGAGRAFDLALVSSFDGCRALARAILCMGPGPTVTDAEVADAIGEIVNMLAGSMKRRLSGLAADLTLGLPIFIHGYLQPSDRLSVLALPIRFGTVDTVVLVAGPRERE
jgi:CheY-specific phosphatase CheX